MNEQLRKLAEQAGYTKDMFGIGHWDMPECEKFAELIVMKCADLVQTYMSRLPEDHELTKQIKAHFGVK